LSCVDAGGRGKIDVLLLYSIKMMVVNNLCLKGMDFEGKWVHRVSEDPQKY
jgi:hypothetical protein